MWLIMPDGEIATVVSRARPDHEPVNWCTCQYQGAAMAKIETTPMAENKNNCRRSRGHFQQHHSIIARTAGKAVKKYALVSRPEPTRHPRNGILWNWLGPSTTRTAK